MKNLLLRLKLVLAKEFVIYIRELDQIEQNYENLITYPREDFSKK